LKENIKRKDSKLHTFIKKSLMKVSTVVQHNGIFCKQHSMKRSRKNSALIKGRIYFKTNQFSFLKYKVILSCVLFTALQSSTDIPDSISFHEALTHSVQVADEIKILNKYTVHFVLM
jgi:hypothetical protein